MKHSIAVVALDTDSGKTIITAALGLLLKQADVDVAVMKPIHTGSPDGRSDDLDFVLDMSGIELTEEQYRHASLYSYPLACSPHLAASEAGEKISIAMIQQSLMLLQADFDTVILETAGGILSPLTDTETNCDLLEAVGCPVIVVVPNKLGAISQTIATLTILQNRKIPILGMILNEHHEITDEFEIKILSDNAQTITKFTGVPVLGRLGNVSKRFDEKVLEQLQGVLPTLLGAQE